MTARAQQYDAVVLRREQLSPHLVRLTLDCPDFVTSGVLDEWVGLVVPGQFQSRYYTVRWSGDGTMMLDVVIHDAGLVTRWASGDCVDDRVAVSEPKGSFSVPDGAGWVVLVGDLTALPAMARISGSVELPLHVWAEVPDQELRDAPYVPGRVTWLDPPTTTASRLAEVVEAMDWPAGPGYFWMAGESAQMRAIRKHVMREVGWPASSYDLMGYWRG